MRGWSGSVPVFDFEGRVSDLAIQHSMSFAPSEMYVTFGRCMIQSLISTAKVTKQDPIVCDASDLAVNAYRRPGDRRSLSAMAIIRLSRKLSRDMGKAIYRSPTTRSGLDHLRTVCGGIVHHDSC